ncbi:MAG: PEP-CTERM sorting domain-containing protein [Pseudomonadota bacterium]
MKIFTLSTSGLLRGLAAGLFAGALLMGFGPSAQATLIGDDIGISVNFGAGPPCQPCESMHTVADPDIELQNGDGSTFGTFIGNLGFAGFIDVTGDTITFAINTAVAPVLIFTDLDWVGESGTLDSVDCEVVSGGLGDVDPSNCGFNIAPSITITDQGDGYDLRLALSCQSNNEDGVCDAGGEWLFTLNVTHEPDPPPPGPPGPNPPGPPGVNIPEPSALLLFGIGLAGLGFMAHRRRQRA